MRALRVVRGAVVLGAVAYTVSVWPGLRTLIHIGPSWDVGLNIFVIFGSALICGLRAFRTVADRLAWTCIGIGLTSYAMGTLLFQAVLQFRSPIPYPSISDGLWLLLYPLAIVGMGLMVRARMAGSVASMWLDGVISGLGLVSVSAAFVFPHLTAGASGPVAAIITNFAYPSLDLALVATAMGAMAALGRWRDRAWLMLSAGFLLFTVADSWYLLQLAAGSYHLGTLVDAMYPAAAALVAMSAVTVSRVDEQPSLKENRSFLVPACFAVLAVAVLAVGDVDGQSISPLGVSLAVGALAASGARTMLAVREVIRLSDSRRQALTDPLTGLSNRRAFYELVDSAEGKGTDGGGDASICIIDLNRFKEINDALGHQIGDIILRAVCDRLAGSVPPPGTIARLGGDEMAVYLPESTVGAAIALSQQLLGAMDEPFQVDDMTLHIGASIGITQFSSGSEVGRALAQADLAMYRAKEARTGWAIYDEEQDGNASDRLAIAEAFRRALGTDELTIDLQPIIHLPSQRCDALEALIRWNHPIRGRIAPDAFLPLVERAGLMPALTRTVIDLAAAQARALRHQGWVIPVSVNLSASDLLDATLDEYIAGVLAAHDLPGEALKIEITESLLVDAQGTAGELLLGLRRLGIDLAVDDYGTGFSCMAYLHDLPVSILKIDRGFTNRVLDDARTATIVASTIEMAHRLDLSVVAEGVETSEQLDWLYANGCDLVQGYLTGRPMPAAALHEWLANNSVASAAQGSVRGGSLQAT